MKFSFATLRVKDIEVTKKFYEEIMGFKEERRIEPRPGMIIVFLKGEGTTGVELIQEEHFIRKDSNVTLTFNVEDIDMTIDSLKENSIVDIKGPYPIGNGNRMIIIKDPDGQDIGMIDA